VIVALTQLGNEFAMNTPLGGLPLLRSRLSQLSKSRLVEIEGVLKEIMQLMVTLDIK
jgi:hypothetical protein